MLSRSNHRALALLVLLVHLTMAVGASACHAAWHTGARPACAAAAPRTQSSEGQQLAAVHSASDELCPVCSYLRASRAARPVQPARPPL